MTIKNIEQIYEHEIKPILLNKKLDIEKVKYETFWEDDKDIETEYYIYVKLKNLSNDININLLEKDIQQELNLPNNVFFYLKNQQKENILLNKKNIKVKDLLIILNKLNPELEIVIPHDEFSGYYSISKIKKEILYKNNKKECCSMPYLDLIDIEENYKKENLKEVLIFS